MSMFDGCFDYNNPPPIEWDHLPPFVQDGEEEIKGWSLPLEVWKPGVSHHYWYGTGRNRVGVMLHSFACFNGRDAFCVAREGSHPAPRVRESELDRNAKRYAVSFFFVWEKD